MWTTGQYQLIRLLLKRGDWSASANAPFGGDNQRAFTGLWCP